MIATPVASLPRTRHIRAHDDLCHETLIEMRGSPEGAWAAALRARGLGEPLRILSFQSYFETMIAAEQGLGVAFGLFPMTSEWVLKRRLGVPFGTRHPVEGGVYLVFRTQDPRQLLLAEVAAWLREQYAALPALPEGRIAPRVA